MPRFAQPLSLINQTAPVAQAGRTVFYAKTDGLYCRRADGVEVGPLGAGAGGTGTSIFTQNEPDPAWPTGQIWFDPDDNSEPVSNLVEAYPFFQTGVLSVKQGVSRVYAEVAFVVESVRASLGTAASGASVIVDVNLNGTSIYGTQANRPTIVAGANTALAGLAGQVVAVGQYLTVDVDQVGSTIPGSDLSVVVRLRRTS